MSYTDPVEPGVTEIERTYDPVTGTATVIRREGRSNTGWWVTGLVLVVAIIATAVVLASRGPAPDTAATAAAAAAQGSAQAAARNAQTAAALAQSDAQASVQATQAAAADAALSRAQAAAAAARATDSAGQQTQDTIPPRTLPPGNDNSPR